MLLKKILMSMLLVMIVGCGVQKVSTQYIIVINQSFNTIEVSKASEEALKTLDQNVLIEDVQYSEEKKYLVTIQTNINEDEVLSVLKSQDWIERVQVNFGINMN